MTSRARTRSSSGRLLVPTRNVSDSSGCRVQFGRRQGSYPWDLGPWRIFRPSATTASAGSRRTRQSTSSAKCVPREYPPAHHAAGVRDPRAAPYAPTGCLPRRRWSSLRNRALHESPGERLRFGVPRRRHVSEQLGQGRLVHRAARSAVRSGSLRGIQNGSVRREVPQFHERVRCAVVAHVAQRVRLDRISGQRDRPVESRWYLQTDPRQQRRRVRGVRPVAEHRWPRRVHGLHLRWWHAGAGHLHQPRWSDHDRG